MRKAAIVGFLVSMAFFGSAYGQTPEDKIYLEQLELQKKMVDEYSKELVIQTKEGKLQQYQASLVGRTRAQMTAEYLTQLAEVTGACVVGVPWVAFNGVVDVLPITDFFALRATDAATNGDMFVEGKNGEQIISSVFGGVVSSVYGALHDDLNLARGNHDLGYAMADVKSGFASLILSYRQMYGQDGGKCVLAVLRAGIARKSLFQDSL